MNFLIKAFLIIFFGFLPNNFLNAVEINCSSPVHKNNPRCKGKTENKTPKEFDTWFPIGFNENREFTNEDLILCIRNLVPLAKTKNKDIQSLRDWFESGNIVSASKY